jgi:PAS domain-containing protein
MSTPSGRLLGEFLRSRRQRLTPKAVGLRGGQRRRTPGLRREEVAELAGIGVDWYVRLEQGRVVCPSSDTIDGLARALRLSKAEHAHLRALTSTVDRPPFKPEVVPAPVRRIVEAINLPAYITGRRWDVLAWNKAADGIFGFSRRGGKETNVLLYMFNVPDARRLFGKSWAEEARRMVALFRATHDLWVGDPAFEDLLRRLRGGCSEFEEWWAAHDVRDIKAGQKSLTYSKAGAVQLEYVTFQSNDEPGLRLTLYRKL